MQGRGSLANYPQFGSVTTALRSNAGVLAKADSETMIKARTLCGGPGGCSCARSQCRGNAVNLRLGSRRIILHAVLHDVITAQREDTEATRQQAVIKICT